MKTLELEAIRMAKGINDDKELARASRQLMQKYELPYIREVWNNARWMARKQNDISYRKGYHLLSTAVWFGLNNKQK